MKIYAVMETPSDRGSERIHSYFAKENDAQEFAKWVVPVAGEHFYVVELEVIE